MPRTPSSCSPACCRPLSPPSHIPKQARSTRRRDRSLESRPAGRSPAIKESRMAAPNSSATSRIARERLSPTGSAAMRDVIIVGAGGGGAVVAKELAERGLDVLLLEAGPRFADLERDWSHFENDANNAFTGYFRVGPGDRASPPAVRELAQSSVILQVSAVGGSTNHYFGNSPRAMPGAFAGYDGADRDAYDVAHPFPFTYRQLVPYYEWVEHTLPVQTAPMGTKEEVFFGGARRLGLPHQSGKDITVAAFRAQQNAILQPGGVAGKTDDAQRLEFPRARGCTFCGHCVQGCFMPRGAPPNLNA